MKNAVFITLYENRDIFFFVFSKKIVFSCFLCLKDKNLKNSKLEEIKIS